MPPPSTPTSPGGLYFEDDLLAREASRDLFVELDRDANGYLSPWELRRGQEVMLQSFTTGAGTSEDLPRLLVCIDGNGDGQVDESEWEDFSRSLYEVAGRKRYLSMLERWMDALPELPSKGIRPPERLRARGGTRPRQGETGEDSMSLPVKSTRSAHQTAPASEEDGGAMVDTRSTRSLPASRVPAPQGGNFGLEIGGAVGSRAKAPDAGLGPRLPEHAASPPTRKASVSSWRRPGAPEPLHSARAPGANPVQSVAGLVLTGNCKSTLDAPAVGKVQSARTTTARGKQAHQQDPPAHGPGRTRAASVSWFGAPKVEKPSSRVAELDGLEEERTSMPSLPPAAEGQRASVTGLPPPAEAQRPRQTRMQGTLVLEVEEEEGQGEAETASPRRSLAQESPSRRSRAATESPSPSARRGLLPPVDGAAASSSSSRTGSKHHTERLASKTDADGSIEVTLTCASPRHYEFELQAPPGRPSSDRPRSGRQKAADADERASISRSSSGCSLEPPPVARAEPQPPAGGPRSDQRQQRGGGGRPTAADAARQLPRSRSSSSRSLASEPQPVVGKTKSDLARQRAAAAAADQTSFGRSSSSRGPSPARGPPEPQPPAGRSDSGRLPRGGRKKTADAAEPPPSARAASGGASPSQVVHEPQPPSSRPNSGRRFRSAARQTAAESAAGEKAPEAVDEPGGAPKAAAGSRCSGISPDSTATTDTAQAVDDALPRLPSGESIAPTLSLAPDPLDIVDEELPVVGKRSTLQAAETVAGAIVGRSSADHLDDDDDDDDDDEDHDTGMQATLLQATNRVMQLDPRNISKERAPSTRRASELPGVSKVATLKAGGKAPFDLPPSPRRATSHEVPNLFRETSKSSIATGSSAARGPSKPPPAGTGNRAASSLAAPKLLPNKKGARQSVAQVPKAQAVIAAAKRAAGGGAASSSEPRKAADGQEGGSEGDEEAGSEGDEGEEDDALHEAASRIQAIQRGKAARRQFNSQRQSTIQACSRIQATLRGAKSRRESGIAAQKDAADKVVADGDGVVRPEEPRTTVDEAWELMTMQMGFVTNQLRVIDFVNTFRWCQETGLNSKMAKLVPQEMPSDIAGTEPPAPDISAGEVAHLCSTLADDKTMTDEEVEASLSAVQENCRSTEHQDLALDVDEVFGFTVYKRIIGLITFYTHIDQEHILAHLFWAKTGCFELTRRMAMVLIERVFQRKLTPSCCILDQVIQNNDYLKTCFQGGLVDKNNKTGLPYSALSLIFSATVKKMPELLDARRKVRVGIRGHKPASKKHPTPQAWSIPLAIRGLAGRTEISVLMEETFKAMPPGAYSSPLHMVVSMISTATEAAQRG